MTTNVGVETVMVIGGDNIEVDRYGNVYDQMTKTKRNTNPTPTTAVISSTRGITNILVNLVDMDLMDL